MDPKLGKQSWNPVPFELAEEKFPGKLSNSALDTPECVSFWTVTIMLCFGFSSGLFTGPEEFRSDNLGNIDCKV